MAPRVLNDHNGGVTENTYFHHLKVREDLKKQAKAIADKLKAANKLAADDGIDLKDLDWAMKQRMLPIEQQIAQHNRRATYLRFMKMPVGQQMNILDEINEDVGLTDEQRQKKWEDEGYVAGKLGQNRDTCPHEDPNSLGARHWMLGYEKGQAELAKGFKKKPDPKAAAAEIAQTEKANGKITKPQVEPEVAAAGKRRASKADGVTYWHNPDLKKVYEIKISDPQPEGATAITRPQYETLQKEYEAASNDDWDAAEPNGDDGEGKGADDGGEPPAPPTLQ